MFLSSFGGGSRRRRAKRMRARPRAYLNNKKNPYLFKKALVEQIKARRGVLEHSVDLGREQEAPTDITCVTSCGWQDILARNRENAMRCGQTVRMYSSSVALSDAYCESRSRLALHHDTGDEQLWGRAHETSDATQALSSSCIFRNRTFVKKWAHPRRRKQVIPFRIHTRVWAHRGCRPPTTKLFRESCVSDKLQI
ncbi:hypothetical protein EVAR_100_1 [Eumeta japonica]|uniref:Uncharacterized protein n=1 Tax=Eumeta variegata TaxID=151549 RepID=A0A4C1S862_EUMVA|nr:hypothetical protein EVAR_100_1 [Eumeta japonica]